MLSNIFTRLITTVRPIQNYQQCFIRLLSTTETIPKENSSNNRETGFVKRFSKEKGYGFISKNSDGTDCFVHFKNINATGFKTLDQGQEVEFTVAQGEKGLEARDVNIIGSGTSRTSFFQRSSNNNSTSSRFGLGGLSRNQSSSSAFDFDGGRRGATSSRLSSADDDLTSFDESENFSPESTSRKLQIGSVKRWSPERGFGFIRRTNGGPDLFCHVRSLRNGLEALEEGQTVQYRIQKTDKGDEARDVTIFDEDTQQHQQQSSSDLDPTERQTGTVRRWLSEKGYGFVRLDNGNSDVFVHCRDLTDGTMSLEEGQTVEFNLKTNEKGPMAQNVTVRNKT